MCVCVCLRRKRYPCPKFNISFLFVSSLQSLYTFNRLATWGLEKSQFLYCLFVWIRSKTKKRWSYFRSFCARTFGVFFALSSQSALEAVKWPLLYLYTSTKGLTPVCNLCCVPVKKKEDSLQVFLEKKNLSSWG